MKRSGLSLASALIATFYAVGLLIFMAMGSGINQRGPDAWDTLVNVISNLALASHTIFIVIGLLLAWIAYAANSAGSSVAAGIMFLIAGFQGFSIIPQTAGFILAALSFFGLFSIRQIRQLNEEKIRRAEERESLRLEREIARLAVARHETAAGHARHEGSLTPAEREKRLKTLLEEPESPQNQRSGMSSAQMAALGTLVALAILALCFFYGPRFLADAERFLDGINAALRANAQ